MSINMSDLIMKNKIKFKMKYIVKDLKINKIN